MTTAETNHRGDRKRIEQTRASHLRPTHYPIQLHHSSSLTGAYPASNHPSIPPIFHPFTPHSSKSRQGNYITTQIQQSQVSSPQSHPKHGFETVWMGFLTLLPLLLDEGRVKFTGEEVAEVVILGFIEVLVLVG